MEYFVVAFIGYVLFWAYKNYNGPKEHTGDSQEHSIKYDYDTEEDDDYSARSPLVEADFIAPGSQIKVGRHQLNDGMVYVGNLGKRPHWDTPKTYINIDAKVATSGEDVFGDSMNYWPSYSRISPESRLAYLRWLATGRRGPEYGVGYVFLFFYGLEQRLFKDEAYEDAPALIQEVIELRKVYGDNGSFNRYSQNFLDMAALLNDIAAGEINYEPMIEPRRSWELPLRLRVAIGSEIKANGGIRADLALDWWIASRERQLSPTVRRVFSELRQVFNLRFDTKFPDGLKFAPPKAQIKDGYHSASGDFSTSISLNLPDVRNTNAPLKKIDAIAQGCIEELKGYSRAKAKAEGGDIPLEALAQLPADVCAAIPSKAADSLRAWLKQTIEGDFTSIAVTDVFEKTGIDFGGKPTAAKVRKVASVLNFAGYGIEPHPDFGGKCDAGQDVVIFQNQGASETPASEAYLGVAHTLTLSVAVANADGEISADEKKHLREMIALEGKWLSAPEQNRLAAHLEWLMACPPTWASLQGKLKKLSLEARRLMARFALATAAADGRIDPGEVKLLEKLYTLMEVDKNQLYTDLHAFEGRQVDQPVSVRAAEQKTDYAIPAKPKSVPKAGEAIILDMSRVEQVRQDTHEISQMLSEVFADPEAEAEQTLEAEVTIEAVDESGAFAGLDADHSLLLDELLAREHWPREDYERLCKEFGLMAEGALETINDWAFDAHDDAVIEDGDTLVINKELLQGVPA
ncbi:MAG: TerB N-terminal domain-containing protein [Candidatus Lindowbacteria bacterium]|nr:TerB N-terminal domain-containing protein [Candidatus Lindowbacteria bacterium]